MDQRQILRIVDPGRRLDHLPGKLVRDPMNLQHLFTRRRRKPRQPQLMRRLGQRPKGEMRRVVHPQKRRDGRLHQIHRPDWRHAVSP